MVYLENLRQLMMCISNHKNISNLLTSEIDGLMNAHFKVTFACASLAHIAHKWNSNRVLCSATPPNNINININTYEQHTDSVSSFQSKCQYSFDFAFSRKLHSHIYNNSHMNIFYSYTRFHSLLGDYI